VDLVVRRTGAPMADDACRVSCDENRRGFIITERYFQ
jgi:hypothetical protein